MLIMYLNYTLINLYRQQQMIIINDFLTDRNARVQYLAFLACCNCQKNEANLNIEKKLF